MVLTSFLVRKLNKILVWTLYVHALGFHSNAIYTTNIYTRKGTRNAS